MEHFEAVLGILTFISIVWFYALTLHTQKLNHKRLLFLENQMRHFTILLDILSDGQYPPIKMLYSKIRQMDPSKINLDRKQVLITFRDTLVEKFSEGRKSLCEAMERNNDPAEKMVQEKTLLELETIITLLSTLDKSDTEQYIEDVLKNMMVSLEKIVGFQNGCSQD